MGNKGVKADTTGTESAGAPAENGRKPSEVTLPLDRFAFPFENVVLQGGGALCLSYCGAIKTLEDARIWKQIKRLSGTGMGGLMATLLAADYTAQEVQDLFVKDVIGKFEVAEASCCPSSELKRYFGLDSGRRLYDWIGAKLKAKTGDADVSFAKLQANCGRELCLVTTNVSQMMTEYCHPKTTPDMPVRVAVAMTMAEPGQFQSIPVTSGRQTDYYVAGGPLCNFPIHCFDGWYLSPAPQDQFCRRIHPLEETSHLQDRSEAFSRYNNKTLGFFPYSEVQRGYAQTVFEQRDGSQRPAKIKKTRLSRKRVHRIENMNEASDQYQSVMTAAVKLLKVVTSYLMKMGTQSISKHELEHALEQILTVDDVNMLQGKHKMPKGRFNMMSPLNIAERAIRFQDSGFSEKQVLALVVGQGCIRELVDALPHQKDGQITYPDVVKFVECKRHEYQERYLHLQRYKIHDLRDFAYCLRETMQMNNERLNLQKCDVERTVGINTYYLRPGDHKLQKEDRALLIKQGELASRRFLTSYVNRKSPPLKDDLRQSYCRDDIKYFIDDNISEIIDLRDYMEPFYT